MSCHVFLLNLSSFPQLCLSQPPLSLTQPFTLVSLWASMTRAISSLVPLVHSSRVVFLECRFNPIALHAHLPTACWIKFELLSLSYKGLHIALCPSLQPHLCLLAHRLPLFPLSFSHHRALALSFPSACTLTIRPSLSSAK